MMFYEWDYTVCNHLGLAFLLTQHNSLETLANYHGYQEFIVFCCLVVFHHMDVSVCLNIPVHKAIQVVTSSL